MRYLGRVLSVFLLAAWCHLLVAGAGAGAGDVLQDGRRFPTEREMELRAAKQRALRGATAAPAVRVALAGVAAAPGRRPGYAVSGRFIEGLAVGARGAGPGLSNRAGRAPDVATAPTVAGVQFRADRVLVAFHDWVDPLQREVALSQVSPYLQAEASRPSPHFSRVAIAAGGGGAGVDEVVARLRADPRVRVAEPDYVVYATETVPNDPSFYRLYGLRNTGQGYNSTTCTACSTPGADISASEAWDTVTGGAQVVVGVIDTGVDYNHPDLAANILRDGSGNVVGYDYANDDPDPMDDNGHGTHCAGTIAAVGNNGVGVAGVCWTAKIMPLKFLSAGGSGATSDAISCIDYAVANGAHILSNSWGGGAFSALLLEAIRRAEAAGILFVASAGNSGLDTDSSPQYPASYNRYAPSVVSVAASDAFDALASFSNYGPSTCDIAAPGVSIYSTYPGNQYATMSGTSMAAPHVAGAAALVKAAHPAAGWPALRARLLYSTDRPAGLEGYTRRGRLNVFNAIQPDATPPGTPAGLAVSRVSGTVARLTWTAPGGDGAAGTVGGYQVLYGTAPGMADAKVVETTFAPGPPGTAETFDLSGLTPRTTYYVGVRAFDMAANVSPTAEAPPAKTGGAALYDGAEAAPLFSGRAPSVWAASAEAAHGGSFSYVESPPGAPDTYSYLMSDGEVALAGPAYCTFWAKLDMEPIEWLWFVVEESGGGTWWYWVASGQGDWAQYQVNMARHAGKSVRVGFNVDRYGGTATTPPSHRVFIDDIALVQLSKVWEDDVEGAAQFTGFAPWGVTESQSSSPAHSWADSPSGNYKNGITLPLMQDAGVGAAACAGFGNLSLVYRAKVDLESGRDYLDVYASGDDGGNWRLLGANTGANQGWAHYSYKLPGDFKRARLMYVLETNLAVGRDGVYLDDIGVWGEAMAAPSPAGVPSDFDGDGKADVLWRNATTGDLYVWTMDGVVRKGPGASIGAVADAGWKVAGMADFDSDGSTDLLWRNYGTGENFVWYMDGLVQSGGESVEAVGDLNWMAAGTGDFNGDGKPDILWRNYSTGANYVWYMDGAAHAGGAPLDTVADLGWKIAGSADFDGDGKADVLWRNTSSGQVYIWTMDGVAKTGGSDLGVVPLEWSIAWTADYNGDGNPDILWRNTATGENYVWYIAGAVQVGGAPVEAVGDLAWDIMPQV